MLTEQDFLRYIEGAWGNTDAAEKCFNTHKSECERLMEIAFNAAKAKRYESDFPYGLEKFKTFKDYKDSLSDAPK